MFKMGMPKAMAKQRAIELMEAVGIPNAEQRYNQFHSNFLVG